ncbi:pepsin/retropepsin-like aspartic protease family protein [Allosphingosinicella deserti]|uniref:Peptidase A2 domain-containing protein n=1 Tax=Allosphingosinicella deserti TaxID=2116704 RepID=A0A2P7QP13_9SPHN|nr:aspartyl protease family protein [Sphingomonas deserti]PSJ39697.1 hypothetical protein C7I55_14005 [Sphingomonas deserti]
MRGEVDRHAPADLCRRGVIAGIAAIPLLSVSAPAAVQAPIVGKIVLEDNRVWVGVTVGGKPPVLFVLDTGAVVSIVQKSYVERLGLKRGGHTRLVGVGGAQDFTLYEGRDVVFGGAIRQPIAVFAVPDQDLGLARDAAGLLAAGLLTSLDTDLDFEAGEWRVYPSGRPDRKGFREVSSQIRPSTPAARGSEYIYVEVELDGRSYQLVADTGFPGQISLFGDATRRSGLWNVERPFSPMQVDGIGGKSSRGRLVRASRVELGSIGFDRPLVSLSQDNHHRGRVDGLIGLELFERLTLSTDVAKNRLWAKPNGRPARPERHGLSGLWLDDRGGRIVVAEVSPASLAAEAGLREGDEILGGTLRQWIGHLAGKPGDRIEFALRRKGVETKAVLMLRAFL